MFRTLFEKARDEALADPLCKSMRLLVERDNEIAQQVYGKMGMENTGDHYHMLNEVDFVLNPLPID